jgi:Phage integrase family
MNTPTKTRNSGKQTEPSRRRALTAAAQRVCDCGLLSDPLLSAKNREPSAGRPVRFWAQNFAQSLTTIKTVRISRVKFRGSCCRFRKDCTLCPVAQRIGIRKRFGWHTFRHTYSTLFRRAGTEFKVMQELLRHSSFRSTWTFTRRQSRRRSMQRRLPWCPSYFLPT